MSVKGIEPKSLSMVLVRQQGQLLLLLVRVRAAFQPTTRSRCITTYYSETFVEHHIHKKEKNSENRKVSNKSKIKTKHCLPPYQHKQRMEWFHITSTHLLSFTFRTISHRIFSIMYILFVLCSIISSCQLPGSTSSSTSPSQAQAAYISISTLDMYAETYAWASCSLEFY